MIRQAVIFADTPHSLHRVGGLSILKRTVLSLSRTNIRQVFVITAPETAVADELADVDLTSCGVEVTEVAVDAPGQLGGDTLTALVGKLDEHVLILGGRHIHGVPSLERASKLQPWDGLLMVVDDSGQRGADVPDDLGVQVQRGDVIAVGTSAGEDADCGVWVVPSMLLGELATGYADGGSLRGRATLVAEGKVRAASMEGGTWYFVGSASARKDAERRLLIGLTKPTDGPIVQNISRRVSRIVTRVLMNTNVTPNQVTMLSTLVGVLGIVIIFQGTWTSLIVGAAVLELQHMLDCCDGELARLKFKSSAIGEWMDTIADGLLNMGYALALGWFCKNTLDSPIYWTIAIASVIGYAFYDIVVYTQLYRVHGRGSGIHFRWWFQKDDVYIKNSLEAGSIVSRVAGMAHALTRREVFLWGFLILAILHIPQVSVIWYALLAAGHAAVTAVHVLRGGMSPAAHPKHGA